VLRNLNDKFKKQNVKSRKCAITTAFISLTIGLTDDGKEKCNVLQVTTWFGKYAPSVGK